jgi:hypothetical protein
MDFSVDEHEETMDRMMGQDDVSVKERNGTLMFGAPDEEMNITRMKNEEDEMGEHMSR